MTHFMIRPAAAADITTLRQIHTENSALTQFQPVAEADQIAFWRDAIRYAEPQLHVACEGPAVVGVVGFDRSRDSGTPPTTGEIWTLQVARACWGRGAALALWDSAREELLQEGCTDVMAWITLGNERAMRFFELAGFKRVMSSARTVTLHGVRSESIRLRRKL